MTLRDVARLAGVHPATASRALNAATRSLVREETAVRVEHAARELDYRPDHVARSLKTRKSSTVGVIVPDLTNPLFPPIVRGIEDQLTPHGYVAFLGNTDNDDARERRVIDGMRDRHIDGLIVATARRDHPLFSESADRGVPVVLVNRILDDHRLSSVSVDDRLGAREAVAHLVALGHRRIGHVAGPQELSTGYGRYRGYLRGLEACAIEPDEKIVVFADAFFESEGYRCATELLATAPDITAVVAGNDMLALGTLRALEATGRSCPYDVSVVGFNDMPFIDRITPPLTTVRLPQYEVGTVAADLLLERIKDPEGPAKVLYLPPELVVRASTAAPRPAG